MQICGPAELSAEEQEKREAWKNRIIYSLPVRVGSWNDDLFLKEEQIRVAGYKRSSCQLLTQKTRKMFQNLLRKVQLAPKAPLLCYGFLYQIQACELPNSLTPETGVKASYGINLAALMNERDLEVGTHFLHGCSLSGSPDREPCVRNTFVFVGCDGQPDGNHIDFGEDLYIRVSESVIGTPLFLQCENSTIDNFGAHLPLRLTQSPDCYCRFRMLHWKPDVRDDTLETGIPANSRVIINHLASGKNLACEYGRWFPTLFGAECEVSCHTFRDTHKMETAENIWKIIGTVRPDINLYVRAAKGEEIPIDLLT